MKVSERLQVSADAFFSSVVTSVLYDIEQATGEKLTAGDLKEGYTYHKSLQAKVGGARKVTTTITAFDAPRLYEASFTSGQGVNTVRYEIAPVEGENAIDVSYEEGFTGNKASTDLNGKLMGSLYSWSAKKRIKKRLHQMETYLQSHPDAGAAADTAASPEELTSAQAEESEE